MMGVIIVIIILVLLMILVLKMGQKIRAGVSPFSGNARKKTFFFTGGLPLYRSAIRLKLLFRMKNLLRKSTLKSMTDHYQCNLKLILEKLHKLIKMSNKWKKCVVFLVRLLLLLPSRSPSKILYARFEQCVFLRIYSPMAINNLIVILLWFINTGDVKCPADLL